MILTDYAALIFSKEQILEFAEIVNIFWAERAHYQKELIDTIRIKGIKDGSIKQLKDFAYILRIDEDYYNSSKYKPACFGFCSDLDSSCDYCGLYRECAQATIVNLPNCFGQCFGLNSICSECILGTTCNVKSSKEFDRTLSFLIPLTDANALTDMLRVYAKVKFVAGVWPGKIRCFYLNRLSFWDRTRIMKGWKSLRVHWNFLQVELGQPPKNLRISPLILNGVRDPVDSGDYFRRL